MIILIAGPPKTASTWLYTQLAAHPEVACLGGKESNFKIQIDLNRIKRSSKKVFMLSDHDLLRRNDPADYNFLRMHNVKLLLVDRNPIERAVSAIKHAYKYNQLSISELLNQDIETLFPDFYKTNYYDYLEQIKKHKLSYFCIKYDDIKKNEMLVFRKLSNFLKIKNQFQEKKVVNNFGNFILIDQFLMLKKFIKPLSYKINKTGKLWTLLKKTYLKYFFRNKDISTTDYNIIEKSINKKRVLRNYLKFQKEVKYY